MQNFTLSIDESGYSDPKSYKISPYFILSGCIIEESVKPDFYLHLNQIKFTYWKDKWKKVFLRSINIGKGNGYFSLLYNLDSKTNKKVPNEKMQFFCNDLRRFYKRNYFNLISCIVNKQKAFTEKTIEFDSGKKRMKYIWSQENVYRLTFKELLKNFLCFLVIRNAKGKIIVEASTNQQDIILYKEFFTLQTNGLLHLGIDHNETKERISSLNFVTKHNKDPEEEIADSMGYAGKLYFMTQNGIKSEQELNIYDLMIRQAYERNLLKIVEKNDVRLRKICKAISSYIVIP